MLEVTCAMGDGALTASNELSRCLKPTCSSRCIEVWLVRLLTASNTLESLSWSDCWGGASGLSGISFPATNFKSITHVTNSKTTTRQDSNPQPQPKVISNRYDEGFRISTLVEHAVL